MVSFYVLISILVLKIVRKVLDFWTNLIFGLINFWKRDKIEPVKDPILLEPAIRLAQLIRQQKLNSVHVVRAYITRIKEVEPIINAVAENRFENALEDARRADELVKSQKYTEEELEKQFPFLGVPFSCKESIAVKGMLFTAGVYANKDVRASENADVVSLLKKAGAIPIASTNTPELCSAWETYNYNYGRTYNPYDTRRIAGGSSGGEGALLGSGASVVGIGSDLGGSVRIPAFFSGVFAHKPTKCIVSNEGQLPKFLSVLKEFTVIGPMCRYAVDLLPMLRVLSSDNAYKLNLTGMVDFKKLKIYYMEDDGGNPWCTPVSAELKQAQQKVLSYFETMYRIKARKAKLDKMRHSMEIFYNMVNSVGQFDIASELVPLDTKFNILLELLKWLLGFSKITTPLLFFIVSNALRNKKPVQKRFIKMADDLQNELKNILDDNSILLYPSHPETAIYHNETLFKFNNFGYTPIFNIFGLPVTQCPLGLSSKGLPLGIQVVGGLDKDNLTLSVAVELEKAFGGWKNPNYHSK